MNKDMNMTEPKAFCLTERRLKKVSNNPKPSELFIRLVRRIGPYGTEHEVATTIQRITGIKLQVDSVGNYYHVIEGGNEGFAFVAHLDTAVRESVSPKLYLIPRNGQAFLETDGKSYLGADDRAGCALLCYMIMNNIPGTYYFFLGEESGCIGSSAAAEEGLLKDKDAMISLDRYGYDSVITHQITGRTASDTFARALAAELANNGEYTGKFTPDDSGVYTDSVEFAGIISECTNLSVGYDGHHSVRESQNLTFLDDLGEALLKVQWSSLPIVRVPQDPIQDRYNFSRIGDNDRLSYREMLSLAIELEDDPDLVWYLRDWKADALSKALRQIINDDTLYVLELLAKSNTLSDLVILSSYNETNGLSVEGGYSEMFGKGETEDDDVPFEMTM